MSQNPVAVLVGTTKGAILLTSDAQRDAWSCRLPMCDGWPFNHGIGDPDSGMIWAGGGGDWHGAGIWRSADGGRSWDDISAELPSTSGFPIPMHPRDPDTVWTLCP